MSYSVNGHYEILVGGKWHYYGEGSFNNHVDFIDEYSRWVDDVGERYLPEDVTETTRLHEEKNEDPKSWISWLSSQEYQSLMSRLSPDITTRKGAYNHGDIHLFYGRFETFPKDKPEEVQDFRVIMWLER